MVDANAWIHEHCRFQRYISATKLRAGLGRARGHCTWCNKLIGGAANRRWCSVACTDEGYLRAGLTVNPVTHRDRGVCRICGVDTKYVQSLLKIAKQKNRIGLINQPSGSVEVWKMIRAFTKFTGYSLSGTPYEIDHIIPVCEGGGCCGADNLRTVCFQCHRLETRKLKKRRAKLKVC
jgi:hypothetical protein